VLVEMGMMSNPTEDRKLATADYQRKLADGMANGIIAYLKTR
jgi:N-acetylmuramoyl-L-alanine amidase